MQSGSVTTKKKWNSESITEKGEYLGLFVGMTFFCFLIHRFRPKT